MLWFGESGSWTAIIACWVIALAASLVMIFRCMALLDFEETSRAFELILHVQCAFLTSGTAFRLVRDSLLFNFDFLCVSQAGSDNEMNSHDKVLYCTAKCL